MSKVTAWYSHMSESTVKKKCPHCGKKLLEHTEEEWEEHISKWLGSFKP